MERESACWTKTKVFERERTFRLLLALAALFAFLFLLVSVTLTALVLHFTLRSTQLTTFPEWDRNIQQPPEEKPERLPLGSTRFDYLSGHTPRVDVPSQGLDEENEGSGEENPTEKVDKTVLVYRPKRTLSKGFSEIDFVEIPNQDDHTQLNTGKGIVFTRWGRLKCPDTPSTTDVYNGTIGAANSGESGGGSNYLCMPSYPEYGYTRENLQYPSGGSLLKGVKYGIGDADPLNRENNHGRSLKTEDAVCSVCYVSIRSVVLMIPARRSCPKNWVEEYKGYLMAARHSTTRTEFVCVDESPESKESGENTSGGAYLYPVEGGCGALPCPRYGNGMELACVVCTK